MGHNVKIKYYARENDKVGTHSFFAQAIPNGTYGFEEICRQASRNTSIEAHTIRAAVEEYLNIVMQKLCDGFRVEVGPQFLTCSPSLVSKVKDEVDKNGVIKKVCTADDLTASGGKSRVKVVVHSDFSYEFANSVKWQKTDRAGNVIDDGEDATTDDEEAADQQEQNGTSQGEGNGTSQGDNGGTSQGDNGGTSQQQNETYNLTIGSTGSGTWTLRNEAGESYTRTTQIAAGTTLFVEIVPTEGYIPTVRLNSEDITLTENDGTYTAQFEMPARSSSIQFYTGTSNNDDHNPIDTGN